MHVLVTGGAGFIGSNFVRYILEKYPDAKVTNLDKLTYAGNRSNLADFEGDQRYRFVQGDICDYPLVRGLLNDVDTIVHFAAESHVDNSITGSDVFIKTNVEGTHTMLKAARDAKVSRFVHVSTDEVYGSTHTGVFSEDSQLAPNSPYSASKAASDLLVRAFVKTYNFPALITRSANNFGPYQYPEKVIPLFVTHLLEGKKVPLYGDGKNVREWLHVIDNCEAIDTVLQKGTVGGVYNIGGVNELSNVELTRRILKALDKDESWIQQVPDRPGHDFRYAITADKIRALGWRPNHDFDTALHNTVNWYRSNQNWWAPLKQRKGL